MYISNFQSTFLASCRSRTRGKTCRTTRTFDQLNHSEETVSLELLKLALKMQPPFIGGGLGTSLLKSPLKTYWLAFFAFKTLLLPL